MILIIIKDVITLQYIRPARPNGIALHEIITSAQTSNNYDVVNLVVSMEIVPSACDYDLPLINVTLLDLENTPGNIYVCHPSPSNSKHETTICMTYYTLIARLLYSMAFLSVQNYKVYL